MKTTRLIHSAILGSLVLAASVSVSTAADVYLNAQNITLSLGPSMGPNPFQNRPTAASLASVIDAPSATASEFHNQSTHVWVSGGTLELVFDFQTEYDLSTLHFWNYHSEGYDVDNIDFRFYDAGNNQVGTLFGVTPRLGNNSGSDGSPILAESYALSFPSKVRYVNAVLSGSNGEVDFNNVGFTGVVTVPEPATSALLLVGAGLLYGMARRKKS